MRCKVCNAELTEGQSFCSYCGTKIEMTEPSTEFDQGNVTVSDPTSKQDQIPGKNPSDGHALAGFILGICSMVCCCIGLPSGILGIIFSAKGLKSNKRKGLAIPGLILSILSVVNFFSFWVGFVTGIEGNYEIFEYMNFLM